MTADPIDLKDWPAFLPDTDLHNLLGELVIARLSRCDAAGLIPGNHARNEHIHAIIAGHSRTEWYALGYDRQVAVIRILLDVKIKPEARITADDQINRDGITISWVIE